MKKFFTVMALAIMSLGVANAQLFIGGEFEIGYNEAGAKLNGDAVGSVKRTSFDLAPKVGYQINEKMAAGVELTYGLENERTYEGKTRITNESTHAIYAAPFFRYYFFEHKKFAIFGEAKVRMGGAIEDEDKNTNNFRLAISVAPYLEYNISEHFALEMGLKFLSLGYGYEADFIKNGSNRAVTESHSFLCGLTTENIFGTLGGITIAAVYKF